MRTSFLFLALMVSSSLVGQKTVVIEINHQEKIWDRQSKMFGCHCNLDALYLYNDSNHLTGIGISFTAVDNRFKLNEYMTVFAGTPTEMVKFLKEVGKFSTENQIKALVMTDIMGHSVEMQYFKSLDKHFVTIWDEEKYYWHQFYPQQIDLELNILITWLDINHIKY